jgi:hypothetical protein
MSILEIFKRFRILDGVFYGKFREGREKIGSEKNRFFAPGPGISDRANMLVFNYISDSYNVR